MNDRIREIAPGLPNAVEALEGVVTAGQPNREHLERLAGAGYKTVVDLREAPEDRRLEEPEAVRRAGMEYASIPVGHEEVDDGTFDRLRELMADRGRRPALVHCSSANRVGALLVPYLVLDEGKSVEEALEIASRVGLRSDELKRAALRYTAIQQRGPRS
jgi:protein tyrosine phosphatase (PTP) superfamily phosphohydrolase (DUF442 family)